MIIHLIEAKVSYNKADTRGFIKKAWEKYLIADISLCAVEKRIVELVSPLAHDGEVSVESLSHTKYEEVIGLDDSSDTDLWFFVRLYYLFVDEKTGKEKKEPHHYLVRASSLNAASIKIDDAMKGCQADYKIDRVVEMGYSDVILNDTEPQIED